METKLKFNLFIVWLRLMYILAIFHVNSMGMLD